ncbi:MAG: 50S ribosomal protein L21 [Candidatus Andersenbacteria bacterium RIFCSPHIGHO2_02_FULL_45_11]|uniref:Large ribosomal subunit protein bL21 n=1 Tax=Candidatus Andersenbacteria bacterium RIFCSPHIGHO2_12_FULL_45_11 TaxID=1797281 RepID=A0A1G1X1M9_9BACT|nr:MAG: 50S ribosomal protein L21 [Candidatus Andersenbacteria bacterium RIFCSPHIGHO2_01_FULL_46_36]OGY32534.1 MAG: 50S ribosomal protein L21 [Candidatus Andersenbacteria bacterium RIFCSPHIGHO2_02_FULL_45_11]OGY33919.1 MAG: 50S ribosomal protein L21 [Candidatus Andersenbacteria bacterium RIFCSPHIGHO2_12_FULL_45_11]
MKTAVIKVLGKQYVVHEGDKLTVDHMQGEEGSKVEFVEVLLSATDEDVQIGMPLVEGVKVEAEIVLQGRHKKVTGVKMKAKKRNMHYFGHKQHMTVVQIGKITAK